MIDYVQKESKIFSIDANYQRDFLSCLRLQKKRITLKLY